MWKSNGTFCQELVYYYIGGRNLFIDEKKELQRNENDRGFVLAYEGMADSGGFQQVQDFLRGRKHISVVPLPEDIETDEFIMFMDTSTKLYGNTSLADACTMVDKDWNQIYMEETIECLKRNTFETVFASVISENSVDKGHRMAYSISRGSL